MQSIPPLIPCNTLAGAMLQLSWTTFTVYRLEKATNNTCCHCACCGEGVSVSLKPATALWLECNRHLDPLGRAGAVSAAHNATKKLLDPQPRLREVTPKTAHSRR